MKPSTSVSRISSVHRSHPQRGSAIPRGLSVGLFVGADVPSGSISVGELVVCVRDIVGFSEGEVVGAAVSTGGRVEGVSVSGTPSVGELVASVEGEDGAAVSTEGEEEGESVSGTRSVGTEVA